MKKYVIILTMVSCTTTVRLDGSKSHAVAGKTLTATKWTAISGNADIENPYALITNVTLKGSGTFELWGQDNEGMEGRDTMKVIVK